MKTLSFMPSMARAWALGCKSKTRRVIKPQPKVVHAIYPDWSIDTNHIFEDGDQRIHCPYGRAGDVLTLLTTWATESKYDKIAPSRLPQDARIWSYFESEAKLDWCGRLRRGAFLPSRFRHLMPQVELVGLDVERVQEITLGDIVCEGVIMPSERMSVFEQFRRWEQLWDSINAKRGFGWDANPWVWVIEFKMVQS